jgi:hypothetical protein
MFLKPQQLLLESPVFSTKLSASSYNHVCLKNNVLFRADSVFILHNERRAMFYPSSFTKFFDYTCGLKELLEGGLTMSTLFPSMVGHFTDGASIAVALLQELGRPDAAYIEIDALGNRFLCNRCPHRVLHDWASLVSSCYSILYRYIHLLLFWPTG